MNKSLTGRLYITIEQLTKLMIHEIRYTHFMIIYVVLHYTQDNHAKGALIVETVGRLLGFIWNLCVIRIGALGVH